MYKNVGTLLKHIYNKNYSIYNINVRGNNYAIWIYKSSYFIIYLWTWNIYINTFYKSIKNLYQEKFLIYLRVTWI